ncbi:unnamed protein product [Ilex paraguariensis]|uniref:FAF domain-containing protein n=1 Tax=Ilex paraguariensis TaxID=185542 RepID=A0ABC8TPD9_9AQUA
MAVCGSLQHIFQQPMPESPRLLDSFSPWNQIKAMKPIEDSSFTDIFGELHCKENHPESSSSSPLPASSPSSLFSSSSLSSSSTSSSSFLNDLNPKAGIENLNKDNNGSLCSNERNNKIPTANYYPGTRRKYSHSNSFSSMNSDNFSLCTEGLGFESSDDLEDLKNEMNIDWPHYEEKTSNRRHSLPENICRDSKRSRTSGRAFPPPISCIGRSGWPWVCFKSYRHDGRFILKEIRIRTQDFLHASREDGRLKLHFIQSDDETLEEAEEEEEEVDEEDDQILEKTGV